MALLLLVVGVVCGLGYVYTAVLRLPRGTPRLLGVLPLFPLLSLLPWEASPNQFHLPAVLAFQCLWVCPSKLLLLCWDSSIDSRPWLLSSFPRFLLAMLLPVRVTSSTAMALREKKKLEKEKQKEITGKEKEREKEKEKQKEKEKGWRCGLVLESGDPSIWTGFLALILLMNVYRFGDSLPQPLIYLAYSVHLYLGLGLLVGGIGSVVSRTMGVETQACFHNPFAASSLGDFWGRRWNLLVNSLLRSTVYDPLLEFMLQTPSSPNKPSNRLVKMYLERPLIQPYLTPPNTSNNLAETYLESPSIRPYPAPNKLNNLSENYSGNPSIQPYPNPLNKPNNLSERYSERCTPPPIWARAIASMAVFLVSGLAHELIFFYLHKSTAYLGHYLAFFLLHGIATTLEFSLKKNLSPRWRISESFSWLCTLLFIYVTACWFFFPVLSETRIAMDTIDEYFRFESFLISLLRRSS